MYIVRIINSPKIIFSFTKMNKNLETSNENGISQILMGLSGSCGQIAHAYTRSQCHLRKQTFQNATLIILNIHLFNFGFYYYAHHGKVRRCFDSYFRHLASKKYLNFLLIMQTCTTWLVLKYIGQEFRFRSNKLIIQKLFIYRKSILYSFRSRYFISIIEYFKNTS